MQNLLAATINFYSTQ